MGSMNNWLGFSLSPQDHPQSSVPQLGFNSDEISTAQISGESCFDAPPFGILEAFNRNTTHSQG